MQFLADAKLDSAHYGAVSPFAFCPKENERVPDVLPEPIGPIRAARHLASLIGPRFFDRRCDY